MERQTPEDNHAGAAGLQNRTLPERRASHGLQAACRRREVGFSEFKRQLLYKAAWYGARVVLADRWEPSSKRCSGCGWLDEKLTLSTRTFACPYCGLVLDRDLNAAINLAKLAGLFLGQYKRSVRAASSGSEP